MIIINLEFLMKNEEMEKLIAQDPSVLGRTKLRLKKLREQTTFSKEFVDIMEPIWVAALAILYNENLSNPSSDLQERISLLKDEYGKMYPIE